MGMEAPSGFGGFWLQEVPLGLGGVSGLWGAAGLGACCPPWLRGEPGLGPVPGCERGGAAGCLWAGGAGRLGCHGDPRLG